MAAGELDQPHRERATGEVVVGTGRRSIARRVIPPSRTLPFRVPQLAAIDQALALAGRSTGLHFSIYLGDLGPDTRAMAEQLHASIGPRAAEAVLIAVSPGQRVVEIVTGAESARRLSDRGCNLAVLNMAASFKKGDLVSGLITGLRMLADQAGPGGAH